MKDIMQTLNTKTILYVEDDLQTIEGNTPMLEHFFKKVHIQTNGFDALECFKKNTPDFVLLDIQMPGISGIEVAKKIREFDLDTKIIMLTAFSQQEYLLESIRNKVEDYLIKPFNVDEFLAALEHSIQNHSKQTQKYIFSDTTYYDFDKHMLLYKDTEVLLGSKENELLRLLLSYKNKTVTKEIIDEHVYDYQMSETGYRSLVKSLRDKVGKENIITVPAIGLKLQCKD